MKKKHFKIELRLNFSFKYLRYGLIFCLSCSTDKIEVNNRTYLFNQSFDKHRVEYVSQFIDSVLNDKNLAKIDTNFISLVKNDSTLRVIFNKNDTSILYLSPYYQVFTNRLGYKLQNQNLIVEVQHQNSTLEIYYPQDSMIISSLITWDDSITYTELEIINPITSAQSIKAAKIITDNILGYISYDSDSSRAKLYLEKDEVILEIPFQKNIPIDKNSAKYFKHTANQISDSVFWGWDTEIRLMNDSNITVSKYTNVDTVYVLEK